MMSLLSASIRFVSQLVSFLCYVQCTEINKDPPPFLIFIQLNVNTHFLLLPDLIILKLSLFAAPNMVTILGFFYPLDNPNQFHFAQGAQICLKIHRWYVYVHVCATWCRSTVYLYNFITFLELSYTCIHLLQN